MTRPCRRRPHILPLDKTPLTGSQGLRWHKIPCQRDGFGSLELCPNNQDVQRAINEVYRSSAAAFNSIKPFSNALARSLCIIAL